MANTSFSYTYRDAGNWKQVETIILKGEISTQDVNMILSKLEYEDLFLPEQVGLPRLQFRWDKLNDDDHIWHELMGKDIMLVDLPANVTMTSQELVENFQKLQDWDVQRSFWTLWSQGAQMGKYEVSPEDENDQLETFGYWNDER